MMQGGGMKVRPAAPNDYFDIGHLLVQVFVGSGFTPEDGTSRLRDVEGRVGSGSALWVATDRPAAGARLMGVVGLVPSEAAGHDMAKRGEGEVQLLAVDPTCRGRGVGEELLRVLIEAARQRGIPRLVLATQPSMTAAQRLYERVGFRRMPERDWSRRNVPRLAYVLDL
jgi:ribosomal protein S18 acetylase RimI-like enzyme